MPSAQQQVRTLTDARLLLRRIYGHETFRDPQDGIIQSLLEGRDSFGLMPTGAGKSLCFQIPAILLPGTGIVISPLVALMDDQVGTLRELGVDAIALHKSRTPEQEQQDFDALQSGNVDLIYVSPERATSYEFERMLIDLGIRINLFAIDEAHCVSCWGHDFRPHYMQLRTLLDRHPEVPRLALTATADPPTQVDILEKLGLRDAVQFRRSMDRANFRFEIGLKLRPLEQLVDFLRDRHDGHSGIVYRMVINDVEATAQYLVKAGFKAEAYHSRLEPQEKQRILKRFLREEGVIVCATIAFGMGIDKPDVRFVAHLDLPKSLEGYLQEAGRAGRDGLPADAWMVWDMEDLTLLRTWIEDSETSQERKIVEHGKIDQLLAYCLAPGCRRQSLRPFFGEPAGEPCGKCDHCEDPPLVEDATIPSQMLLSAIRRTQESATAHDIVDIVHGHSYPSLVRHGWTELKTFGVGAEHSKDQLHHWMHQLVGGGYAHMDLLDGKRLKITIKGTEVLAKREHVELQRLLASRTAARKIKQQSQPADGSFTKVLAALKTAREQEAARLDIPAYMIMTELVMNEIARKRPATVTDLSRIRGLGEAIVRNHGKWILDIFRMHPVSKTLPRSDSEIIEQLRSRLRYRRLLVASLQGIQPEEVFASTVIEKLVKSLPNTFEALLRIEGISVTTAQSHWNWIEEEMRANGHDVGLSPGTLTKVLQAATPARLVPREESHQEWSVAKVMEFVASAPHRKIVPGRLNALEHNKSWELYWNRYSALWAALLDGTTEALSVDEHRVLKFRSVLEKNSKDIEAGCEWEEALLAMCRRLYFLRNFPNKIQD